MWLCRPRTTFSPCSTNTHICKQAYLCVSYHKWQLLAQDLGTKQTIFWRGTAWPCSQVPPDLIERSLGTRLGQSGLRRQLLSVSVVLSRVWEGMPRGGSLKGTDNSVGVLSEGTVPEDGGNTWAHPRDDCSFQDLKNSRYGQRCHRGSETL